MSRSMNTFGFAMLSQATILWLSGGCSMAEPDRQERMQHGYIYYFDGAGGGGRS